MWRIVGLLIVAFASCGASCTRGVVRDPNVVESTMLIYVPVPAELTQHPREIAHGPLRDAPKVARKRKAALEACYGQLDGIAAIQGTAAPAPSPAPACPVEPAPR